MADYDTPGGGAGPNWHSTAASTAHEWAHWNPDYVGDAVTTAAGGNWAAVNARIDAITVPKAANADAAAARVALTPLVDAEIGRWRAATIARWNALIGELTHPAQVDGATPRARRCSQHTSPRFAPSRPPRAGSP